MEVSPQDTNVYKVWPDGFSVRRMRKEDAKIVQKWFGAICATSCDLDIVLDDIYPPHVHGFYIGEYKGEVVASAIRIPVTSDIYYGSYFYVEEKYRKLGFGRRIRDEVAAPLLGGHVLAIDAHDELEAMNQRRGYQSSYKVVLYSGKVTTDSMKAIAPTNCRILPVDEVAFEKVVAYDNKCFVRPKSEYRSKFLKRWLKIQGGKTIVACAENGDVIGFGCRRPAFQEKNHLIGPLYADSFELAFNIFKTLCLDIENENVSLNICEPNTDALSLVTTAGLHDEIHMIRMYLNGKVDYDQNPRVYALTSIDVCGF